ncbi:GGDEF domain-containing protein [Comamonas fluminis]|uniref:GGDEF domain-containing protein n=1 Tax=Comamonas fluminis TaxID=2796366 RepID=UPI001C492FEA|nr:GGDEF domain-containing protein [Comamonas fluminis]
MNEPADLYFALIAPACVVLFGVVLVLCWWAQRHRAQSKYLLWLAAGYVLPAAALAAQSLMSNAQLGKTALLTGVLYLSGAWCLAQGMSLRFAGRRASVLAGLLIGGFALSGVFYFSELSDRLWIRVLFLNLGVGLLQLLAVLPPHRLSAGADKLEKTVRWTYGLFAIYSLLRAVAIWLLPVQENAELTRSGYWLLTLAGTTLFSLWFALVLLACSVRDVFMTLRDERNRDQLTRLLNRRAFMEAAEPLLQDRRLTSWAVVAVDIDHFKQINDNWGHGAGDHVLQQFGLLLPQQVRDRDLVARFGGEEFMLLLSDVQLFEAHAIVERIRASLQSHVFEQLPSNARVTASFGVAPLTSLQGLDAALRQADELLYQAKKAGRNCVQMPGMPEFAHTQPMPVLGASESIALSAG